MDSLLFNRGFNECDLGALDDLVTADLEFYHDQSGIQDRAAFFRAVEENICSSPDRKPLRRLVPGSVEVFPLYRDGELYGGLQTGRHEFYIREPEREPYMTSTASFAHLWLRSDSGWALSRVLSYDHGAPPSYGPQFDAGHPAPLFTTDDEVLSLLREHAIPSLGVGYIRDGRLQQVRVFGETRAGHAAGYDTVYRVASLAKPVTALVVLKLADAGLWDLDDPVHRYYTDPDVEGDPRLPRLTTRHILTHQSGFPNWRYLTESGRLAFEFEPGTRHQYSGEGFEYLRKAVESRLGRSLAALASEYVFGPLSMTRTSYVWESWVGEGDYAVEHDGAGAPLAFERHTEANAAANLLTTVGDYGTFMAHVLGGAGLSDDLFAEFVRPAAEQEPGIAWGLGVQVLPGLSGGAYALQHTGGDDGLKALAVMLPESGRGLLVLSNSENGRVLWSLLLEEVLGPDGEEIVRRNLE